MLTLLVLLATGLCLSEARCPSCGVSPCQTPVCCDSGYYTLDDCGCCLTCAKAQDEICGGPLNIEGQCATGLRCLRQCECQTVRGRNCIFPFNYEGQTYNSCTTTESSSGAAWCAAEVNSTTGEAVVRQDCDDLCPGAGFACTEGFLGLVEGRCINGFDTSNLQDGLYPYILDDVPQDQRPAPRCNPDPLQLLGNFLRGRPRPASSNKICRCEETTKIDLDGNPQGGCTPPRDEVDTENLKHGWCYLENVVDPSDPQRGCYKDAQWSEVDGRFWSNIACLEKSLE